MNVLVTGASGFVGSNLIKRLIEEGWLVHAVVRQSSNLKNLDSVHEKIKFHHYDGTTSTLIDIVRQANPSIVFHLAALTRSSHSEEDIDLLIDSNIAFSTQLIEAMSKNGIKNIINTGTFWQYYNGIKSSPTCLYAATKQAFECILQYYVQAHSLRAMNLIIFDNYGPFDSRRKIFSLLAESVKTRKLLSMSPGEQLIDLIHIDDLVEAYMIAMKLILSDGFDGFHEYKVSSNNLIKLKDLVGLYQKILNVELSINWGGQPYRDREIMIPNVPINLLPGWQPRIALTDGIKSLPI